MSLLRSSRNGAEFEQFFAHWSCGNEHCWRQGRHVEWRSLRAKHTCGKRRVSALSFPLSKPVLQPAATVSGEGRRVRSRVVFRTCASLKANIPHALRMRAAGDAKAAFKEIGRQSVGKGLRGMGCGTSRIRVAYTKV